MDDYDNRVPSDPNQVFPNAAFSESLSLEGRIIEASIAYDMQGNQLETTMSRVQEERDAREFHNERYFHHVPYEVQEERDAREVLLRIAPTEENLRASVQVADRLGISTTTIHANIDPNAFPPVAEVTAPAFSGPPHRLQEVILASSASTGPSVVPSAANEPALPKATPKSPPSDIGPAQSPPQYTSWICRNPTLPHPQSPTMLMLADESAWIDSQSVMMKDGPFFRPQHYGADPNSTPSEPELPTIPQDALAQDTDLSGFPTFTSWKEAMWSAPFDAAHEAEVMTSYKPISYTIIGFDSPVSMMSDLAPPSGSHVYIPIPWDAECVKPPYEDFLDGCRIPPLRTGLTGYDALPLSYKGPMVEEEYWNRMVALWRKKNDARRDQAAMVAQLKGIPLEYGDFGTMPYYKKVPKTHRARRFQLGKLAIMLQDRKDEANANLRCVEAAVDAVDLLVASQNLLGHDPIDASALNAESVLGDSIETATVAEGVSPRNLDDVQVDDSEMDAQLASNQAVDGASASASDGSTPAAAAALQRRAHLKI
eukprot:2078712-Amphidinium_carterae.1